MSTRLNPAAVVAPAGPYSHGVAVDVPGRWLHIAGQIGVRVDGSIPAAAAEQAQVAWENLVAILAEAGMTVAHLVKINTYVVEPTDVPAVGAVRAKFLGDARPASTLVVVKALVKPEWLFEVDGVAFLPG